MRSGSKKKKIIFRRGGGHAAAAGALFPVRKPSHGSNVASRPHAASPRLAHPLARTHERNEYDFPVGLTQSPIKKYLGMFHLLPGQHQSLHCKVYLGMSQKAKDKDPLKMLKCQ